MSPRHVNEYNPTGKTFCILTNRDHAVSVSNGFFGEISMIQLVSRIDEHEQKNVRRHDEKKNYRQKEINCIIRVRSNTRGHNNITRAECIGTLNTNVLYAKIIK